MYSVAFYSLSRHDDDKLSRLHKACRRILRAHAVLSSRNKTDVINCVILLTDKEWVSINEYINDVEFPPDGAKIVHAWMTDLDTLREFGRA